MVNLIIGLISIALFAIIAVAALYNGGDAFRQGSAKASAAQLVNAGQQISAANILYANDNSGSYTTSLSDLTDEGAYLSSTPRVPEGFTVNSDLTDNVVVIEGGASDEVCEAVNKQAGYGDEVILADKAAVTEAFGCFGVAGTSATFVFN